MNPTREIGPSGRSRAAPRRRALVLLGLAALLTSGCQSMNLCGRRDPCSDVGPLRRMGQRVFNRGGSAPASVDCEPGFIGGTTLDTGCSTGAAPVISSPAPLSTDSGTLDMSPSSPVVTPNPTNGTTTAPDAGSIPPEAPGASNTKTNGGASRATYEAMKPPGGTDTARRGGDPLADIPRLEAIEPGAGALPAPADEVAGRGTGAGATAAPATAGADAAASAVPTPTGAEGPAASLAPGIASFTVVEPRLAAGARPTAAGWAWLAEQGYKTALDLRPADQWRSEDVAAINSSGLRHVVLPTPAAAVDDPAHLARFAAELAQESARPIYVFDVDGSRAAVLIYLHRVVNLKATPEEAARDAAAIGPRDEALWKAAAAVVERTRPKAPPADAATTPATPEAPAGPVPDQEEPATAPAPGRSAARDPRGDRLGFQAKPVVHRVFPIVPRGTTAPDPAAWKPYAALAAAGLVVPFAFLGRSAVSRVSAARATLPAPARSPRAIADALGA